MGHIITDLKEAFRRGNVFIQLIYINVGIFVATALINILLQLFNRSAAGIFELLALPASFTRFILQPCHCSLICSCMPVLCIFCLICFGYIGLVNYSSTSFPASIYAVYIFWEVYAEDYCT